MLGFGFFLFLYNENIVGYNFSMKDKLSFFGLLDEPFRLSPDTEYFYPSKSHKDALELLSYSIKDGDGFVLVVGYPGIGKTTLLRKFLKTIPDRWEFALIVTPMLNPPELIKAVLNDLDIEHNSNDLAKNLNIFQSYLLNLAKNNKKLLLVIDEAQSLPIESLEQIRLLSNIELQNKKPLHIILSGQPELEKMVKNQIRQLNQRITIRCYLYPFTQEETEEYIQYRMAKANGMVPLSKDAKKEIFKRTNGIPRLINSVMKRALAIAYSKNRKEISKLDIEEAADSLNLPFEDIKKSIAIGIIVATAVLMVIAFAMYFNI